MPDLTKYAEELHKGVLALLQERLSDPTLPASERGKLQQAKHDLLNASEPEPERKYSDEHKL